VLCRFIETDDRERLDNLPNHYFTMTSYLSSIDSQLPAGSTLFFGDSQIQHLCVSCVESGAANFGIGHDTTSGLLHRLIDYRSLAIAKRVLVAIGTNDLKRRDNRAVINNYQKIIATIPTEVDLYWLAILPIDSAHQSTHGRQNRRITEINQAARRLCLARPGCRFIDVTEALADDHGDLRGDYHRGDGLHLNSIGYQRLIKILREHLNPTNH